MTTLATAGAVLRIDLGALVENYAIVGRQVAPARVAAVVKADAYGIGAARAVGALADAGCRTFFVAVLDEAAALMPLLPPEAELFVLNGLQPGAEAECAAIGAIPVLNSLDQIDRWSSLARARGQWLRGALQVDTGMSRMGMSPQEVALLLGEPDRLRGVKPAMLMSHFACADEPDHPFNGEQAACFSRIASGFPGLPRALDNSGGAFLAQDHLDIVRAGIALYGGAPHGGVNPMRAVVSLEARIAQLRTVPAGTGIGYGLTHRARRETRIATIPVGYADGLPRTLGNRGSAFVAGIRVPMVGRVSMDSITLDVTDVPERHLRPGAPVEILGPNQTIDDLARDAGTISYEILTQLSRRYARDYVPAAGLAQRSVAR